MTAGQLLLILVLLPVALTVVWWVTAAVVAVLHGIGVTLGLVAKVDRREQYR